MTDHPYIPSGYTTASSVQQDACLHCGRSREAHEAKPEKPATGPRVEFPWGGKQWAFDSPAEARRAGFYVEVEDDERSI